MPVETGLLVAGQNRGFSAAVPSRLGGNQSAQARMAPLSAGTQDKLDRAKQALNALNQANSNWRGLRQSMAAMRLQRLVAIIRVMMMYGGDPKMVAQRAADLTRELRAAVKDFAASGGDPSTVPGATDPSGSVNTAGTGAGAQAAAAPSITASVSGFASQASNILDQLKIVVALSRQSKAVHAEDDTKKKFDDVAQSAAAAIDQAAAAPQSGQTPFNLLI